METSESAAPFEAALTPYRGAVANGVLVTGMHRSGTSAVAHVLAAAGLNTGPADDQMAPTIENPRGYAELMPVMEFNDRLLAAKGWTWDAPPATPLAVSNEPSDVVDDGRHVIRSVVSQSPWLLKDPRVSLLLPDWRKILLDRFIVVFTLRPPAEVAWSLAVRNDLSVSLALALWAAYYRHLCAGLNGLSAVAVDYVALATDPEQTTRTLFDALRDLDVDVETDAISAARAVSAELRRTTVPATVEQAASAFSFEQLIPGLERRPVTVYEKFDLTYGEPRSWETDVLDEHRARRHAEIAAGRSAEELDGARRELDAARDEAGRAHAEVTQAREDAQRLRDESHRIAAERDLRGAEVDRLSNERDGLARDVEAAVAAREELAEAAERLRNANERMANEVARAREDNERLLEAGEGARGRATQLEGLVNEYASSTSWRLTAPLRRLGQAARGAIRRG